MIPYDASLAEEELPWIVENLWLAGRVNCMFGPEKSGKSRLLGWFLAGVLGGAPVVLGQRVAKVPSKILYHAGS